jgi:hypothetical protein
VADFDQLVEMLNFAVAIAMLLEFAAFIKLRITDDDGKPSLWLALIGHDYLLLSLTLGLILFSHLLS